MKILKRKETNIVITAMTTTSIEENDTVRCDDVIYADCTLENCEVVDNVTLPPKFVGGCYTYINDVWTCVNTEQFERAFPTLKVSMRQARLGLLARNLLNPVNQHISSLSQAAQIEWEYSTEVKRDNVLVLEMQTLLGLTDADLDLFFEESKLL